MDLDHHTSLLSVGPVHEFELNFKKNKYKFLYLRSLTCEAIRRTNAPCRTARRLRGSWYPGTKKHKLETTIRIRMRLFGGFFMFFFSLCHKNDIRWTVIHFFFYIFYRSYRCNYLKFAFFFFFRFSHRKTFCFFFFTSKIYN